MVDRLSIANKTTKRIPHALLHRIFSLVSKKRTIEVSVAFIGDRAMRTVNRKWQKKDAQTNVLAFPLGAEMGEILINPHEAKREARMYGMPYAERIAYLFLHGLLHLHGYDHKIEKEAKRMERKEQEIMHLIFKF